MEPMDTPMIALWSRRAAVMVSVGHPLARRRARG
jgi:hypothetical protein